MVIRLTKRWISLLLAMLMIWALLPQTEWTAYAAETSAAIVDGLEFSVGGDDKLEVNGDKVNVTAAGVPSKSEGCNTTTAESKTTTLTIKNITAEQGLLSFSYNVAKLGNTTAYVVINGEKFTAVSAGTREMTLEAGASIEIVAYSGSPKESKDKTQYTTTAELSNFSFVADKTVTTTFRPAAAGGSFSVDGANCASAVSFSEKAEKLFQLKAAANSGYYFAGWYSETQGIYLSRSAEWAARFGEDQTVTAVFAAKDTPLFQVGNSIKYLTTDLHQACESAKTHGEKKITLLESGRLPQGEYRIPDGVTLLIPCDEAQTVYTRENCIVTASAGKSTVYRQLTMESGASITFGSGSMLDVASKVYGGSGSENSYPTGPRGHIAMENGSSITLENGAVMVCFGFVTGSGHVVAKNGSKVWECFQVTAWRGGSATSGMVMNKKVFPMAQYYVQNIEAPLVMHVGAEERVLVSTVMSGKQHDGDGSLIGNSTSSLFRVSEGTITKWYDGQKDRLVIEVDGKSSVESMKVTVVASISTEDFVLPIANMTIRVHEGSSMAFNSNAALIPGTEMEVAANADVSVEAGKNLYLYDSVDWVGKHYALSTADFKPVVYAPGQINKRTAAGLTDARLDINGTVTVNGSLYTTQGDEKGSAEIISSAGTGKIVFAKAPTAKSSIYQATQSNTTVNYPEVAVIAPTLKNAAAEAAEYSKTAAAKAGDTFFYHENAWDANTDETDPHYPHIPKITEPGTPATCTGPGISDAAVCEICGRTLSVAEPIEALGHDWGEWEIAKDSTCTEAGEETRVCQNDATHIEKREIALKEHQIVQDEAVEPTCEKTGLTAGSHCANCDTQTVKQEVIPALQHDFQTETIAAICEQDGKIITTCSRCDYRKEETIAAPGHDWGEWEITKDSTCTAVGEESRVCQNDATHIEKREIALKEHQIVQDAAVEATCEKTGLTAGSHCANCDTQTVKQEVIPALQHDLQTETIAATCEQDGKVITTCSRCDYKKEEPIEKLGHDFQTETIEAACEQDGKIITTCSRCDYRKEETIAAPGHDWGEWEITKESTCTEAGEESRVCQNDAAHVEKREIALKEHQIVQDEAVEPTCEKTGLTAGSHCANCDTQTVKQEVIPALQHDLRTETIGASCEQDGKVITTCSRCDYRKEETIAASGHDWGEWEITKESTCTEAGEETRVCKNDAAHAEKREIALKEHQIVQDAAVEPTCEKTGLTAGSHCANCDTQTVKQEVIPAKKHTAGEEKIENRIESTCTVGGSYEKVVYCADCKKEFWRETIRLEPAAHELVKTDAQEATCTEAGNYEYYTCKGCSGMFSDSAAQNLITPADTIKPASGHAWGEWKLETEATCTEDGSSVRVCGNDGRHTEHRTEPALGHDMQYTPEKAATCEEDGNVAYNTCSRCEKNFDPVSGEQLNSVVVNATGHEYVSAVTREPSCEEDGVRTYTCSHAGCGDSYTEPISASGHKYGAPVSWNWEYNEEQDTYEVTAAFECLVCGGAVDAAADSVTKETKEVSCTEDGYTQYSAVVYFEGNEYTATKDDKILAEGHLWEASNWDWNEDGSGAVLTMRCHCGEELTEELESELISMQDATCAEKGFEVRQVKSEYGFENTKTFEIAAPGHDLTFVEPVEAACEAGGNEEYYVCGVCGKLFADPEAEQETSLSAVQTAALGHDFDEGVVTTEPTCIAEGIRTYTCRHDAAHTRTESIARTAHTPERVEAVAATCETEGMGAYMKCSVCGKTFGEDGAEIDIAALVIPAAGHQYAGGEIVWAENGEGGYSASKTFICERDPAHQVVVPAQITVETTAATYDAPGKTVYTAVLSFEGETYTASKEIAIKQLEKPSSGGGGGGGGGGMTVTPTPEKTPVVEIEDENVALSDQPGSGAEDIHFVDVAENAWYKNAVMNVAKKGVMNGTSRTTFKPESAVTRGMVVTILWNLENKPKTGTGTFRDVSSSEWYADAVKWAAANKVVAGYGDGLFKPDQYVSREEFATILYNYAIYKDQDTSKKADLSKYADAGTVQPYAADPMAWANGNQMINGATAVTLDPAGVCTRAQTASILTGYMAQFVK